MTRHLSFVALAALLAPGFGPARAASAPPVPADASGPPIAVARAASEAVLPPPSAVVTVSAGPAAEFTHAPGAGSAFTSIGPQTSGHAELSSISGTRFESTRYRPRRGGSRSGGGWRARGVSQLHVGFLDLDGPPEAGFLAGFRGGQRLDDMVEVGLGIDWRTKSGRTTELLRESVGPGGETIVVRREVSSFSSNLFPLMAYFQLSGPSHLTLVPYAGVAASWQVLFLEANEYATGERIDATFDGFGWQLWGGVAFPLSGRSRLVGEVFLNQADLHRDLFDPFVGEDIRETVSTDGVGARFGMNWGF